MSLRVLTEGLVLCVALAFTSGQVWAQAEDSGGKVEEKEKKRGRRGKKRAELPPELKQYLEMMAPGAEHKALGTLVGDWNAKASYSPAAGAPVQESKGSMRRRWIMGGRYIQEDYRGSFMGLRFQGLGFTGYDKLKKTYVSIWMDSMSTGIMMQTGKLSDDGKTLKLVGDVLDPQTGKAKKFIRVIRIEGSDKHIDQMYEEGTDGNERKVMEITYTRRPPRKEVQRPGRGEKKDGPRGVGGGRKKASGSTTNEKSSRRNTDVR